MGCSVMIIAKNEESNIVECMLSCSKFATQFVVIDDFSTDATVKRIEESQFAGITNVYQRSLDGDWGGQQTYGIKACTEEWVFLIDADERCTPELAEEIYQHVQQAPTKAYWVKRINHFAKQKVRHGTLSPDWVLRLLPQKDSYVEGRVHPKICVSVPEVRLREVMLHYTYQDWAQYERKMNLYSTLAAQKYFQERKKVSCLPIDMLFRPFLAFVKMYLLKGGFLDGTLGWVLSHQYANYTMAKYIKLAELYRKEKAEKAGK